MSYLYHINTTNDLLSSVSVDSQGNSWRFAEMGLLQLSNKAFLILVTFAIKSISIDQRFGKNKIRKYAGAQETF